MDNQSNKVYINPNFNKKRSTHLNKHYSHQLPNVTQNNQRKIFINPNFIALNNHHINYQQLNPCQQQNIFDTSSFNRQPHYDIGPPIQGYTQNTEQLYLTNQIPESINFMSTHNEHFINSQSVNIYVGVQNNQIVDKSNNIPPLVPPRSKSRYSLLNNKSIDLKDKIETNVIPNMVNKTVIQENYNSSKLIITKPKYCLIRNNSNYGNINKVNNNVNQGNFSSSNKVVNKNLERTPLPNENKTCLIKLSKYKTVSMSKYRKDQLLTKKDHPQNKIIMDKSKALMSKVIQPVSNLNSNKNKFKLVRRSFVKINKGKVATALTFSNNKQKIKLLTKRYKTNNIPCPLYTKYGKCLRKDKGTCEFLHDKKYVSLCRKFLKGICHEPTCLLSHELSDKKMPTCYFYLKGICLKEHCPYVHIKLSEKSRICEDWLKGYCEKGNGCLFRHERTDNRLKKTNTSLNKSLRTNKLIRKLKDNSKLVTQGNSTEVLKKSTGVIEDKTKSELEVRYYKEVEPKAGEQCVTIQPLRCKLGVLPSYIKL